MAGRLRLAPAALALAFFAVPAAAPGQSAVALDDAVRQTLLNNHDIAVERISVLAAEADIRIAESEFSLSLGASADLSSSKSPNASALADPVTDSGRVTAGADITGKAASGATYRLGIDAGQARSGSTFQSLDPVYNAALSLSVTQPLLKNSGRQVNMWRVDAGRAAREIAENAVKAKVDAAVTAVVTAYWELIYAQRSLEANGQLLAWARELERKIRIQVEAGTLAPLEIVAAQSSVASAEERVVAAQSQMERSADNLLAIMNPPAGSPLWSGRIQAAPVLGAPSAPPEKDYAAMALENRPEMAAARLEIEAKNVELVYQENQKLPSLDLTATLRANGLRGGAQPALDIKTGQTITSPLDGDFGSALADSTAGRYYDYSLGLSFTIPLDAAGREARRAKSAFAVETAVLKLKNLERAVANDARNAYRETVNGLKRLQAAAASRELAEKRLEAETSKFEAGVSTPFNVLALQKDLAAEKEREGRAMADLMIAKAALARAVGRSLEAQGMAVEGANLR